MLHMLTGTGRRYVQLPQLSCRTLLHAVRHHSLPSAILHQLMLHLSMPGTIS